MSYERLVELQRWPGIGFGFSVIGGSDTHIPPMICALVRDSPALLSNQVFVGDVLCKVNGVNVSQYETKEVVDLIRNCKDRIVLSLKEDRLAKLKARPFLAEGNLIDPPRGTRTPPVQNHITTNPQTNSHKSPKVHHKSPGLKHKSPVAYRGSPRQGRSDLGDITDGGHVIKQPLTQSYSYTQSVPVNHQSRQAYVRSVVGGPKTYEYGADGRFIPKNSSLENLTLSDLSSDVSFDQNDRYRQHSSIMQSPKLQKGSPHVYNVEDLPPSPRSFIANNRNHSPNVSYRCLANNDKYDSYDYISFKPNANDSRGNHNNYVSSQITGTTSLHNNDQSRLQDGSRIAPESSNYHINYDRRYNQAVSAPHNKSKHDQHFEFEDGACASFIRQQSIDKSRPYSNPEIDNMYVEDYSNQEPVVLNHLQQQVRHQNFRQQNSNFSSPNVFEEADRTYSEHKGLTLTPNTQSVHSLNNRNFYSDQDMRFNDRIQHLSPLSINTPNSSVEGASSTASPVISTTSATSNTSDTISPADIASRLFTLNGYKSSDVAPLLGKNSDFSQQICHEYLQFFNFEGLSLDESIRVFLNKFPFTGETQERERILIQFSKRYLECNKSSEMSEDAIHTLVCAIMLLNTDLHGQSITNKMTVNDFITNLSGLCDGGDFPKEYLKTLYSAIKTKEIIFMRKIRFTPEVKITVAYYLGRETFQRVTSEKSDIQNSPRPGRRKNSAPGNPFIELKTDSNDAVLCEGLIYRKSVMDSGGRRTPAMRRNWRPYYCILKGLVLLSYKPDNINSHEPQTIGVHHSLTGYAKDYKKRAYVFKLITADWSVYYIQAKNQDEVRSWMDSLNVSAALLSSPPLPAPVSSSMRFQRPVMPVSRTKLTLAQQITHHQEKVVTLEADLSNHTEYTPDTTNKHYQEWENKLDYLEFEEKDTSQDVNVKNQLKRFKAYVSVLTSKRLEHVRAKILADPNHTPTSTLLKPLTKADKARSSSMHSLTSPAQMASPRTQKRLYDENRQSYLVGPVSP